MRLWERPKKEMVYNISYNEEGTLDSRMRVRLFIKTGKIANYTVQLEHMLGKDWIHVVRFNYCHGFVHKDFYNRNGEQTKKTDLGTFPDLREAVEMAMADIRHNYKRYISIFKEGF
jgi:hypothetical protein